MPSFRTGALLALFSPLCLAADAAATHTFFPTHAGYGDQLYLLHPSDCEDLQVPASEATLTRVVEADGMIVWILEYEVRPAACDTPPYHDTVYAFALPPGVGSSLAEQVHLRLIDADTGDVATWTPLPLLPRVGMPPSIAGTWFNPDLPQQGLMLGYDQRFEIAASWNTYAANGTPQWLTGIAPTNRHQSYLSIPLHTVLAGDFTGTEADPGAIRPWGALTLDYVGCGQMVAHWTPHAWTGLSPGSAALTQLTGSFSESCDLGAWAQRNGHTLTTVVPELIEIYLTP